MMHLLFRDDLADRAYMARYADVPVVVMTAVRGLTVPPAVLGASDVVEKPFDIDDLLNKVALAIYRSRHQQRPDPPVVAPPPPTPAPTPTEAKAPTPPKPTAEPKAPVEPKPAPAPTPKKSESDNPF